MTYSAPDPEEGAKGGAETGHSRDMTVPVTKILPPRCGRKGFPILGDTNVGGVTATEIFTHVKLNVSRSKRVL